jgi:4a-hydroxytetrahydrobiopterin dehydratase
MDDLSLKKCVPCEGGVKPFTREQAQEYLDYRSGWSLSENGQCITREFAFKDFSEAFGFLTHVAVLAEREGHHPDIELRYNRVFLSLTTHAIKGLSENDFIMAAKIDTIEK